MMSLVNYYDTLGCTKDSTAEDIKRAYRTLILKNHPDKSTSKFDGAKFQRILEAWKVLRDPESREEYDTIQKQEELDAESLLIYARVSVQELETIADNEDILTYRCRCGGLYCINRNSVHKKNQNVCVPCLECTFLIVVET